MGLLGTILSFVFNKLEDNYYEKSDQYYSGYGEGSYKASNMTDKELKASIQRSANNGVSNWKDAGKTRAMVDEYKKRK